MMNLDGLKGPFPPSLVTDSFDAAVLREKCERFGVTIEDYEGDGGAKYTIRMDNGFAINVHRGYREEIDWFLYGCEAMQHAGGRAVGSTKLLADTDHAAAAVVDDSGRHA